MASRGISRSSPPSGPRNTHRFNGSGILGCPASEALEQGEPERSALLWVKLHGSEVFPRERRDELDPVLRRAEHPCLVDRIEVVRVHEVELILRRDALEQRMR